MEHRMIPTKLLAKPDDNIQGQPITVMVGSAKKFRGIPEPGDHIKRPLMVNAWSQTTCNEFSILKDIENRVHQSQREKELEQKIRVLEENLKAHAELLSQIHATSAKTSALLGQQQLQSQQYINNVSYSNNSANGFISNRTSQLSPKIVNSINTIQQVTCSPTESIKYTIIAEGTGSHTDEPIEVQLAEDDGALNLNSSADSGRLEICLAPEENIEIKTEYTTANNTMLMQRLTDATANDSKAYEHHVIKKRKLAAEHELLTKSSKCWNEHTTVSIDNVQPKLVNEKHRNSVNTSLNTSTSNSNNSSLNIQTTPIQNFIPTANNDTNNSPHQIGVGEVCHIDGSADNAMVSIGPNNTRIPAKLYETMNWTSASIATRKLLMAIFDRKILATHSMTGKPSPAFKDHGKPIKQMLNPQVISDIIFIVTRKCNASDKEVRNAITTKCADENKMMKLQMNKRTPMKEINKENVVG